MEILQMLGGSRKAKEQDIAVFVHGDDFVTHGEWQYNVVGCVGVTKKGRGILGRILTLCDRRCGLEADTWHSEIVCTSMGLLTVLDRIHNPRSQRRGQRKRLDGRGRAADPTVPELDRRQAEEWPRPRKVTGATKENSTISPQASTIDAGIPTATCPTDALDRLCRLRSDKEQHVWFRGVFSVRTVSAPGARHR